MHHWIAVLFSTSQGHLFWKEFIDSWNKTKYCNEMYSTYISGFSPMVQWPHVSEMYLGRVNSETRMQTQLRFKSLILKFGSWMFLFGCTQMTHKLDPATAHWLNCHPSSCFMWLVCVFGLGREVDQRWSSFQLISNKFQSKTRQNFLWSVGVPQDDKMIELFSIVRSKRWKNNFVSSHAFPHSSQKLPSVGGLCIFLKMCTSHLSFQTTAVRLPLTVALMMVYPKVSWQAAWSENCKWYSSLPLGAVVSLFCESV
jgi:hypothetical protein